MWRSLIEAGKVEATIDKAIEVLGSSDKAYRWLLTPNRALDGLVPLSIMDTPEGRETVTIILGRIEYGIFS